MVLYLKCVLLKWEDAHKVCQQLNNCSWDHKNMSITDLNTFRLDKDLSYDLDLSLQVVRALSIVDTLLSKKVECIDVFKPLAIQFVPQITDEELYTVINDYILSPGVVCVIDSIYVGKLSTGAIMHMDLVGEGEFRVPYIYFDAFLAIQDRGNRQLYLHLVKILHELCHVLTPGLIRLSQIINTTVSTGSGTPPADLPKFPPRFATPEKIGPICFGRGNSGCGFEDAALGGRLVVDANYMKAPFAHPLQLKKLPYPQFPPTPTGNDSLSIIPDEYVADIVTQWMDWLEHGGKIPLLKIPLEGLTVIKLMKFVSPEEAKLHFDKRGERQMAAKQTPAERASKRHKKNRAEEEDTCSINTSHYYNKYLMGANEDDEEFYAQEQSVITGGINAQQLEAMEKDPFLRY